MNIYFKIVILFCVCILSYEANAQLAHNKKSNSPIEILSDEAQYYNADNKAVFKGNVVATQDDLVIKVPLMEVDLDRSSKKGDDAHGGVSKAFLSGGVQITSNGDTATSETGEYDGKTGVIILRKNVVLTQKGNTMYGDELIYSSSTGESVLKRDPKNKDSRVRAHIIPKKEEK